MPGALATHHPPDSFSRYLFTAAHVFVFDQTRRQRPVAGSHAHSVQIFASSAAAKAPWLTSALFGCLILWDICIQPVFESISRRPPSRDLPDSQPVLGYLPIVGRRTTRTADELAALTFDPCWPSKAMDRELDICHGLSTTRHATPIRSADA